MGTEKVDLTDVTFLFSFRIDSPDRLENLGATLKFLVNAVHSKFIMLEVGPFKAVDASFLDRFGNDIIYKYVQDESDFFYRTYYNDLLIALVLTPYYAFVDADVIVAVSQLEQAVSILRENEVTAVYPYDGRFYETNIFLKRLFLQNGSVDCLQKFITHHTLSFSRSYGGMVILNKRLYQLCGNENLGIRGWGPDDVERVRRMRIFGHQIERVAGPLFHLHHERNEFSLPLYVEENRNEYFRICASVNTHDKQIMIK